MNFKEGLQKLSIQIMERKNHINNEEMTKQALLIPFLQVLDFDVFNPLEVKSEYVDHIDHDTLNNKKYNLRLASNSNNNKHRGKINTNNTSGYRNVCWVSSKEQWCVQLQINGKCVRFGYFDDVHEAGKLAEEMRKKYYKEYAGVS